MDSYTVFILASLLLAITPGPDNLFVLTQSALYGKKAGLLITLGLCTGLIFHTSVVAFGFAIILQSSWALVALKSLGACYLLYLAFKSLTATIATFKAPVPLSNIALYRRGIIMNSTNPKVSLFFLAFLPQFIFIESGSTINQVLILGGLFAVTGFCVFTCIAYAGDSLQQRLNNTPNVQLSLNRIAGIVFIALAINLII
jgi:threonine/homoserine/homoserine lactone efflux protein